MEIREAEALSGEPWPGGGVWIWTELRMQEGDLPRAEEGLVLLQSVGQPEINVIM